jgi:16S rRNA (uracil1498-N3)-methyltransferase
MTHAHFFLPAREWASGNLRLSGEEAKHCAQVTRHRVGDVLVVFDGAGRKAEARIDTLGKTEVTLTVLKEWQVPPTLRPVTLVQAVTKGETFEWILEKAVELGVQRILPVLSDRSIVRLDSRDAAKKHEKWQRLVLESCKQCGQAWLPELALPTSLAAAGTTALRLVASLQSEANPVLPSALKDANALAIAIGPEGDFSPAEYDLLASAGWHSWSLGDLVLRSETAALYALSVLRHELHS